MIHEGAPASITKLTKRTRPGEPSDRFIEQAALRRVPAELTGPPSRDHRL